MLPRSSLVLHPSKTLWQLEMKSKGSSKGDGLLLTINPNSAIRHIIQELQLENTKAAQRSKVLESENKLLLTEMDQLREVRSYVASLELSLTSGDRI